MDRPKLTDRLGIPPAAVTQEIQLHMDGNARLVLEGHRGLLEFGPERIRLKGKNLVLLIEGRQLNIEAIDAEQIALVGRIDAVSFSVL